MLIPLLRFFYARAVCTAPFGLPTQPSGAITRLLFALLISGFLLIAAPAMAQPPARELDWVYLENEQLRVGLLRSHGGAIGFLSPAGSPRNLLNHYDHGRLVQQSYYGDEDGSQWTHKPWRFNPVQAGDYQGHAAELLEFRSTQATAYARTRPRNWAGGQLLAECEMEQWVELDGPLVKLKFKFTYRGERRHALRDQETPAMFVAPELTKLITYSGDRPWTDQELSTKVPGWPNEELKMTENWVAWVNEQGQGVGLYVPSASRATCYRYQGGSGSDCSYVAPLNQFALLPDLNFTYSAWLTTGESAEIRARFKTLYTSQSSPPQEAPDQ